MQNPDHDLQQESPAMVDKVLAEGSDETIRIRQGITGQGVRYVLALGLGGVILAFVIIAFLFPGG